MKRLILFILILCPLTAIAQTNGVGAIIPKHARDIQIKGPRLTVTDSVEIIILDRGGDGYAEMFDMHRIEYCEKLSSPQCIDTP